MSRAPAMDASANHYIFCWRVGKGSCVREIHFWVSQFATNDPKHTSGHIKNWFQRRRVDLLDWPSQSPDLNPIEQFWEELERRVQGFRASNVNQKFDLLEAAWKDIPISVIHKRLDSMPHRCQAVIDAKGYATRY
uniref:DDE_3 domain-containing protein n=1 Tax=Caenorhabditis japonica TaxID=281687 RepID=A0A8R1HHJ1_CAEJA